MGASSFASSFLDLSVRCRSPCVGEGPARELIATRHLDECAEDSIGAATSGIEAIEVDTSPKQAPHVAGEGGTE